MIGWSVDPGSERSGLVIYEWLPGAVESPWGVAPITAEQVPNAELLRALSGFARCSTGCPTFLVVECMLSLFVAKRSGANRDNTGRDQLEAERMAGGLLAIAEHVLIETVDGEDVPLVERVARISRSAARAAVTGSASGTDADVRRGVIDMYGGDSRAFGKSCARCKSTGLRPTRIDPERPCDQCDGSGWLIPRGPLHGFTGSHSFAALACAIAAHQPGGPLCSR